VTSPDEPAPIAARADETMLYSLAANCSLYEEADQPPQLNVGSDREPRMVAPAEAWRDFYARNLVGRVGADVAQMLDVRAWAVGRRPSAPPSMPDSDRFGRDEWDIAIELCDRAVEIVRGAGAEEDEFARQRLLAAIEHTLQLDTFGAIAGVAARSSSDLVDQLERIQRQEDGGRD
jgi:hypothetical protein